MKCVVQDLLLALWIAHVHFTNDAGVSPDRIIRRFGFVTGVFFNVIKEKLCVCLMNVIQYFGAF